LKNGQDKNGVFRLPPVAIKEDKMSVNIEDFGKAIDTLRGINRRSYEYIKEDGMLAYMGSTHILYELKRVSVYAGRRVGHSTYIQNNITNKDILILPNIRAYSAIYKPDIPVTQVWVPAMNLSVLRTRYRGLKSPTIIWVDLFSKIADSDIQNALICICNSESIDYQWMYTFS